MNRHLPDAALAHWCPTREPLAIASFFRVWLGALLLTSLVLVPRDVLAVEGYVLFTRGSGFGAAGALYMVEVGGSPTHIADNVGSAVFSPDGRRIAYAKGGTIYRANRDGSNKTQLTQGWSTDIDLSWRIPNTIVFANNQETRIRALDVDSGAVSTFYQSSQKLWSVSVSTNGRRMTFYTRSNARGIWIADVQTGNEVFVHSGCGNSLSPDGSLFSNNLDTHQDMYIRRWDRSVYKSLGTGNSEYWNSHRWSSNSNAWITYSRGPDFYLSGYSDVAIRNIENNAEVRITSLHAHDTHRDFWQGNAPLVPTLQLDRPSVSFAAKIDGANPAPREVQVSNGGADTLSDVSASESATWLTVTRSGAGNAQVLTNSAEVTGLATGSYSTTVTVSGGGATSSVSYEVELVVAPLDPIEDNTPPEVDAGADASGAVGDMIALLGTASDDGFPTGTLSTSWTAVSGPGDVVFVDATAAATEASFTVEGTYLLQLDANDGLASASDEVSVEVSPFVPATITVIEPDGGDVWTVGSEQHIRWTTQKCTDVTIRISTDGGDSWEMVSSSVDERSEDWLDFTWEVPETPSDQVIIRITDYLDGQLFDDSDATFEIRAPPAPLVDPTLEAVTCSGTAPSAWVLLALLGAWRRRRRP